MNTTKFQWHALAEGGPTQEEALRGVWLYEPHGKDCENIQWVRYTPIGYDPLREGKTHFSYYPHPEFPKA